MSDALQPNILWQNDGGGRLTDGTGAYGTSANGPGFAGGHSIGAAWGDVDNDGKSLELDLPKKDDRPVRKVVRNQQSLKPT